MFTNKLKAKLKTGQPCYGILDSTANAEVSEMLGCLGFDFVLLDAEHGKLNLENLENLIRACELSGTTPIVRPPICKSEWICPMLDRGAHGVYLPHFETVEDAQIAVSSCYYAPKGMRGYMPIGRPNNFGYDMSVPEFLERSNEEILIIGLVETALGLENLDDILAVDGIDAIWIGAGDLSQSMGHPGVADHPEVVAAVDVAIQKIVAANKFAGWAGSDNLNSHYMELGATLFHGVLQGLVQTGAQAWLDERADEWAAAGK